MKVALYVALLFCLILVAGGVAVWFIPANEMHVIGKIIVCLFSAGTGIGFGAMAIECIMED